MTIMGAKIQINIKKRTFFFQNFFHQMSVDFTSNRSGQARGVTLNLKRIEQHHNLK